MGKFLGWVRIVENNGLQRFFTKYRKYTKYDNFNSKQLFSFYFRCPEI